MFYNSLPYGDSDSFNEKVTWDSPWTKASYLMMTKIFLENNSIMTKAYVLQALKYVAEEDDHVSVSEVGSEGQIDDMKSQLIPEVKSQLIPDKLDVIEGSHDGDDKVRKRKSRNRSPMVTPNGRDYTFLSVVLVSVFFIVQLI